MRHRSKDEALAMFRRNLLEAGAGLDFTGRQYDRLKLKPARPNLLRRFGNISWTAMKKLALEGGLPPPNAQASSKTSTNDTGETFSREFGHDSGIIESRSRRIKTLEQALAQAEVDLSVWEVERYVVNDWEVGAKLPNPETGDDELKVEPLRQIKVWLRRIVPTIQERIFAGLTERLAAIDHGRHRRTYHPVRDPHCLEISLFDVHFGKLAWEPETGNDYDLRIAERLYDRGVSDLLMKARGFPIDEIIFVIGQDFFHINNPEFTTTHGTKQDVDGRLAKIFETGALAVMHAIDRCIEQAPVKVLWIPGNHDAETSWFLAKYLEAWYRNAPSVRVDSGPSQRKYHRYGINLIGFTHGDEEPHRDLPSIMAVERREDWGEVRQCEWHVGHLHKRRETRYLAGDTHVGIGVRILPSLSGIDAWHYRKGYVQTMRIAEAYLWSYTRGYTGHLATTFDEREYSSDVMD